MLLQRSGDLTIILLDANDNAPTFQRPSYDTSVPEVSQIYLNELLYKWFCDFFSVTASYLLVNNVHLTISCCCERKAFFGVILAQEGEQVIS